MEDAKSKLLLVPSEGNPTAEKAATDLHVPIATLKLTASGGKPPSYHQSAEVTCIPTCVSLNIIERLHLGYTNSCLFCSGSDAQKQGVPSEARICRAGGPPQAGGRGPVPAYQRNNQQTQGEQGSSSSVHTLPNGALSRANVYDCSTCCLTPGTPCLQATCLRIQRFRLSPSFLVR